MKYMRAVYLVTGAAGNLGGNVVRELVARGDNVRALVLPGDSLASRLPKGVEVFEGDLLSADDLDRFFAVEEGADIIVLHVAGIVTTYPEFSQEVYDVNVLGTRNVVERCIRANVRKLVYVSSTSAIPELPHGRCITEVDTFDPDAVVGFYGKTKAEASSLVMDAVKRRGLDASIVFPSGLCGPGDYAVGHLSRILLDASAGKFPAGIYGGFDAVDVRDVAHGIVLCADRGRRGENYILGNRVVTLAEIFHAVHEQTGAKEVRAMIPLWLAKLAVPLLEVYYKVKKRPPVFTKFALYNLTRNNEYSSEKARRELGYTTRPFEETIADTLAWLKSEGLAGL
jgi:dihydroflavonol-4-reductase